MQAYKIKVEPTLKKAAPGIDLLKKYAKDMEFCEEATHTVSFEEDTSLCGDGYRIENADGSLTIFGNTAVAFNAAVGKLLRTGADEITTLSCQFDQEIRAIYFANHFHNYYHCAPMEEIMDYMETLALWGQSVVWLWFDMHHFSSIRSTEAQEMIGRMKQIFAKARELGMQTALTKLSNEYYEGGPQELLAENSTASGLYKARMCGFFGTELCPSREDGKRLIIQALQELLDAFRDTGVDYLTLWPYDQGGCSCQNCYPWGGNGFYHLSRELAAIIKEQYPSTKVGISTWYFDHFTAIPCEYEEFFKLAQKDPIWFDYIISNKDHPAMAPFKGKIPVISFPEISMAATPWGGYGAAPIPTKIAEKLDTYATYCNGCMVYSEGIFEDINKIICLEKCRDKTCDVHSIVREYCTMLVGKELSEELTELIFAMELTLPRSITNSKGENMEYPAEPPKELYIYSIHRKDLVRNIRDRFLALHEKVSEEAKQDWRYEILYLRALGDDELCQNNGIPNDATDKIYTRLVEIFHAKQAGYFVSPITKESIMANREHI